MSAGLEKRAGEAIWRGPLARGAALVAALVALPSTHAVILLGTADPETNTEAPTGRLSDSGWDLQGQWGPFLGTPIGPRHFLSAQHIGGSVGDVFSFRSTSYRTIAMFDDPLTDLRIWEIEGAFPEFAPLYSSSSETGEAIVVFGRGPQRGDPVSLETVDGPELRGWRWGAADGRQRWGENKVEDIVDGDVLGKTAERGAAPVGELLRATFDEDGGDNEAHLSTGDSGGGVFLREGGVWKLAGINYAVDGSYDFSDVGTGFAAAIFDQRGLFVGEEGDWKLVENSADPAPGAFYATRVSSRASWINEVLTQPVPDQPVLQSASDPRGPYADMPGASSDTSSRTITISVPEAARFFRLRGGTRSMIQAVQVTAGQLVFRY